MQKAEIENIEIELLIQALFQRYNIDFREYARASFYRRINAFIKKYEIDDICALIHKLLNDEELFLKFKYSISVPVTDFFRDPKVYKEIREVIIPYLSTYPEIRIWNAGCSTGQEAYSLAILLDEEKLLDKTYIYATDFNISSLNTAREGIYSTDEIKQGTANFLKTNTKTPFSNYYRSMYDKCIMSAKLKSRITFIEHNLTEIKPFDKFNMIICRNVFIYFTKTLQSKILNLFHASLIQNGYLCLGLKESTDFIDKNQLFSTINEKLKLYRRKNYPQGY